MKISAFLLSITWLITSIFIIYLAIISNKKYNYICFNIKKIFLSLKSKSKNNITPLSSLSVSLAAKIGVGSLSGIALAIYFGGIGTMFWIVIISLFISINTYIECLLGIKYREKIADSYIGGPSYYIKKCLGNKILSKLYGIIVIISYSILFLSVQSNTISKVISNYHININYLAIILFIICLVIIINGISIITKINNKLVPIMLILYLLLGIYITINNYYHLPGIFLKVIAEAFKPKSIISVFLIGMERAIFVTESSLGTSAIAASTCDNEAHSQGMLEVLGIYITIFIVCVTTFLIIVTSNYQNIWLGNINGIEIILYAFKYHFGAIGEVFLSIITILFALSTIISSYYFGESNLYIFKNYKVLKLLYKLLFMIVIISSLYINSTILWNLTDFFVAILALINTYAIIKIINKPV